MAKTSRAASPLYLLDANALIALCWSAHEHHGAMLNWFKTHASQGWATCPLTQAAFVRVILQPAFSGQSLLASEVIDLLAQNTAHPQHRFLPIHFDMMQVQTACTGGLLGHRQITDAWLLATAIAHQAKLLTFDRGIQTLLATDEERAAHIHLLKAGRALH
jgi:uncharacterized protein